MLTNQFTDKFKDLNDDPRSGQQRADAGPAGAAVSEVVDPVAEETYWREAYSARPYFDENIPIEMVMLAYRYGWESRVLYDDMTYRDVEAHLRREWNRNDKGNVCRLNWDQARHAIRDAWERVTNAFRAKEKAQRTG